MRVTDTMLDLAIEIRTLKRLRQQIRRAYGSNMSFNQGLADAIEMIDRRIERAQKKLNKEDERWQTQS